MTVADGEDERLKAFDYHLPDGQVACFPPEHRDGGRLLRMEDGVWHDRMVTDFDECFRSGDLLIVNDTRVLAARLFGRRSTGGRVEILLLQADTVQATAMVRPSRKVKDGESIVLLDKAGVQSPHHVVMGQTKDDGVRTVVLSSEPSVVLAECGHMPIPPYLGREASKSDEVRYQTVFAKEPGAIAAPTASLHLTHSLLDRIRATGTNVATVTLHVGPGTFRNLRQEDLDKGELHWERYTVPEQTQKAIEACRTAGGRVTAVGTTVTRTLESAATKDGYVRSGSRKTNLFIQPGFEFRVVDRLLTNLHLPRSSLLMLVSAFGGHERVMAGYAEAVLRGYRFYSYGDAMFLDLDRGTS